jgi:hypothetical protein
MGRILQGFVIVTVAVVSSLVYSWREMTTTTARSIALLQEKVEPLTPPLSPKRQEQVFNELPSVVQTYLTKALPAFNKDNISSYSTRIESLTMKQKGTFRIQDNDWEPFTATQVVSANPQNVGFVWDAIVYVKEPIPTFLKSSDAHLELPCFVQDTYVKGKGSLNARLLGVLRVAHLEDSPDINAGELLRWLAESFLIPTVFLTNEMLEWTPIESDPNKARLTVTDPLAPKHPVSLTITFDAETGMPVSAMGLRAKATGDEFGIGGFSYTRWQGNFGEYEKVDGMMVPTKCDVGWYQGKDTLNLYFKGENYDFRYQYNE